MLCSLWTTKIIVYNIRGQFYILWSPKSWVKYVNNCNPVLSVTYCEDGHYSELLQEIREESMFCLIKCKDFVEELTWEHLICTYRGGHERTLLAGGWGGQTEKQQVDNFAGAHIVWMKTRENKVG